MLKKSFSLLICLLFVFFCTAVAFADEITEEKEYKPLDMVVVMDASWSMNESDPERAEIAAVRMVANMMPAEDSRLGVISFNANAYVLSKDSAGKPALLPMIEYSNLESIRTAIRDVQYTSDTAIGTALYEATKMLETQSDSTHERAILLFSDGMTDLNGDVRGEMISNNRESDAIRWAQENNVTIYTAGYNYVDRNGIASMGTNGEGLQRLKNMAESTGGRFAQCTSMTDAEQWFIDFLADVLDEIYVEVDSYVADQNVHTSTIEITPSVSELNIRIALENGEPLDKEDITLVDPFGKTVELKNENPVRFDVDAAAVFIKYIRPAAGEWQIAIRGGSGAKVRIGLLEHIKVNLTTRLIFPDAHPNVAYAGDEIGLCVSLTYNGSVLQDESLYTSVNSAVAEITSRADPDHPKTINLGLENKEFTGSFIVEKDSYYDIVFRLTWDMFYREAHANLPSGNQPVGLKKDLPDKLVLTGKNITIGSLLDYVEDFENDPVHIDSIFVMQPDVADAQMNGNDLVAVGKKMGSTLVTVTYMDAQGNPVAATFKLTVLNPLVLALLILIVLGILAAIAVTIALYIEKVIKIKGNLYLISVECEKKSESGELSLEKVFCKDPEDADADPNVICLSMRLFYRYKRNRNVNAIVSRFVNEMVQAADEQKDLSDICKFMDSQDAKALMSGADRSKIKGSPNGGSFTVKVSKNAPFLRVNKSAVVSISRENRNLEFEFNSRFGKKTPDSRSERIRIMTRFETNVRSLKRK